MCISPYKHITETLPTVSELSNILPQRIETTVSDQSTLGNTSDIKFNLPQVPSLSFFLSFRALGLFNSSRISSFFSLHSAIAAILIPNCCCCYQSIFRLMNPFTVSHLSSMLSSPSLPPPPLSTAGASSVSISAPTGGACSGLIPRLDIWLGRSASWARSLKIKTRGGAESSSVVSTRRKFGRRALLTSDMGAGEEVGSRPLLQVQSGEG